MILCTSSLSARIEYIRGSSLLTSTYAVLFSVFLPYTNTILKQIVCRLHQARTSSPPCVIGEKNFANTTTYEYNIVASDETSFKGHLFKYSYPI